MVDDFMVCVDRLIASACLVNGDREADNNNVEAARRSGLEENGVISVKGGNGEAGSSSLKKKVADVVECRICLEEDEEHSMEAPCACNGTLKFAHRKCIQRWCNKKGNVTCEICNQVFSPNYSIPPAHSNPDIFAIDIRQAWGQHIDLRDSSLLALAAAEHQFLESGYEDYAVDNTRSIACFRSVALILMTVLLLRQVLMVTRDAGIVQESSKNFNFQVSLLQFAGFILPCYVLARSWYILQCRRRTHRLLGHN